MGHPPEQAVPQSLKAKHGPRPARTIGPDGSYKMQHQMAVDVQLPARQQELKFLKDDRNIGLRFCEVLLCYTLPPKTS